MSVAILLVGSLGSLLYVLVSFRCVRQSCMYSFLSSITMVLPLSVFLITMSLLFARCFSAVRSCGVRLSLGCLYFIWVRVCFVSVMYLLSVSLDVCGKLFVRSVSLAVNCVKSCSMSDLSLLLGMGMNERPFSKSAVSCMDSGCEDLFVTNLLWRRLTLCLKLCNLLLVCVLSLSLLLVKLLHVKLLQVLFMKMGGR